VCSSENTFCVSSLTPSALSQSQQSTSVKFLQFNNPSADFQSQPRTSDGIAKLIKPSAPFQPQPSTSAGITELFKPSALSQPQPSTSAGIAQLRKPSAPSQPQPSTSAAIVKLNTPLANSLTNTKKDKSIQCEIPTSSKQPKDLSVSTPPTPSTVEVVRQSQNRLVIVDCDPVKWDFNNEIQEYIALNGFNQNINADF
jgi:hypothetical protein